MRQMIQVPFGNYGQTVSRLMPVGDPRAYKTFTAAMPLRSHFRPATCEEAGCDQYRSGWVTTIDLSTIDGQKMAHLVQHDKTRRWSIQKVTPTLVKVIYGPGQRCFRPHQVRNDAPPRFIARSGDFRGNPDGRKTVHTSAQFWIEDQQETLDLVRTRLQRG